MPSLQVVLTHRPAKDWFRSYTGMAQSLGPNYAFWTYWIPEVRFPILPPVLTAELTFSIPQCYWQRQMSMKGILPLWLSKYGEFDEHMMAARLEEAKKK